MIACDTATRGVKRYMKTTTRAASRPSTSKSCCGHSGTAREHAAGIIPDYGFAWIQAKHPLKGGPQRAFGRKISANWRVIFRPSKDDGEAQDVDYITITIERRIQPCR